MVSLQLKGRQKNVRMKAKIKTKIPTKIGSIGLREVSLCCQRYGSVCGVYDKALGANLVDVDKLFIDYAGGIGL